MSLQLTNDSVALVQTSFMFSQTQPHASAHAYEVALFGEFFARDLKAILNRLTLHTESAVPMHTREILFEQFGVQSQVQGDEPALLRAKKELGDGTESGWSVGQPLERRRRINDDIGRFSHSSSRSPYAFIRRQLSDRGLPAK